MGKLPLSPATRRPHQPYGQPPPRPLPRFRWPCVGPSVGVQLPGPIPGLVSEGPVLLSPQDCSLLGVLEMEEVMTHVSLLRVLVGFWGCTSRRPRSHLRGGPVCCDSSDGGLAACLVAAAGKAQAPPLGITGASLLMHQEQVAHFKRAGIFERCPKHGSVSRRK